MCTFYAFSKYVLESLSVFVQFERHRYHVLIVAMPHCWMIRKDLLSQPFYLMNVVNDHFDGSNIGQICCDIFDS